LIFLLPSSAATRILSYGALGGSIDVKVDLTDEVALLVGASKGDKLKLPVSSDWLKDHYLSQASTHPGVGAWYRASQGLAADGFDRAIRSEGLDTETEFRPRVSGWNMPPLDGGWWVVTVEVNNGESPTWAAWQVSRTDARWFPLTLVDETAPLLFPLAGSWPVEGVAGRHVSVIGAGSIGSAAAMALAAHGVRQMTIVDPDHLEPRNFARHQLHRRVTGRRKAMALRDHLLDRDPDLTVDARILNVITDADEIRELLQSTDIVLCATDGVASRRAINHMAVWARKDAVFACVIEDGAYGEVLRVRPYRTGCLQCDRDVLYDSGAFDPEPELDSDYTSGGAARPMTAVGGDLTFVGQMAARVVVASLLERAGDRAQALPGDAVTIALRPVPDLRPPFDLERAMEIRWRPLPEPRPNCPSCGR
jgi:hypothetical protein